MARAKKTPRAAKRTASQSRVSIDRGEEKDSGNFLDRIQTDLEKNQSYLNLILGALIVIVLGVLVFNYFNKPSDQGNVTPQAETTTDEQGDVTKEALPGKYKVKEGDTLFSIAQKYYDDGGKYSEISKENKLLSENIEVDQELTIPKIEAIVLASSSPEVSASPTEEALVSPSPEASLAPVSEASPVTAPESGKGGAINQTVWGGTITSDSYTVQSGDWLSKIAGRAYGDVMKYDAIAKANNISNPDNIEVGTVLKIPRN